MTGRLKIVALLLTLAFIVGGSTIFFRYVEGWSWLDAYFFTVVTISTVGYGELVPATAIGKIATTLLIFVGLGVFALSVQQFAAFAMKKREQHVDMLVARLGTHHADQHTANRDETPGA